ncbi:MAG: 4Fe-4S dicluster domain-containing protein [Candidatus Hermodarchaeota archaeon]
MIEKTKTPKSRFLAAASLVFRNLRTRGSATVMYPRVSVPLPERFRGVPAPDDKCVACNICAQDCPSQCIEISEVWEPNDKGKEFKIMTINIFQCIYCGQCEDVCPYDAMHMTDDWENSTHTKDEMYRTYKIIRKE